jgi:hypothetical protein
MKTTVELPDELMRAVKTCAVNEDRDLRDMIAVLLRRGLAQRSNDEPSPGLRVQLPLIRGGHPAPPGQELTPERVAEILLADDVPPV